MDWGIVFSSEVLKFFRRASLTLVIDTRASLNLKIKHKRQNNSFSIILLFNNMSLSYPCPPCEAFTPPGLTTQGLAYLSDTIMAIEEIS